jgi:glycosyltransferase involved in cell wall biosynthesis
MSTPILCCADIRFPLERANGIQTMETCAALARGGRDVTLIVRPDTSVPPRDPFEYYGVAPEPRLRIERIAVAGPPGARRAQYLVRALIRTVGSRRAHVVLTRDLGFASLYLRARPLTGGALVYESHGFAPSVSEGRPAMLTGAAAASAGKQRRLARRERFVWRRADGYATITRGLADELSGRFGARPALGVVPDGARLDPARAWAPRAAATPPVVAYSGHLYPWKGVDVLLDALARLPGVRGLIVGGHPREADLGRLEARAAALGLADRVRFAGMVEPFRVAGLLDEADVLALPNTPTAVSARYTSPLKLFEYLALGRPLVASDLPAFREVLRDGDNALLFEPGNAAALAAAIGRAIGDPTLAARVSRRAFETAREYSWERRAERLAALIDEAVDRRAGTAARAAGEPS